MKSKAFCYSVISMVFASTTGSAGSTAKNWKDVGQLTYVSANGNSKSDTTGFSNLFQFAKNRFGLDLTAAALGARSDGSVTSEQYNAGEKTSWKLDERNYAFQKIDWEKNRFSGVLNKYEFSTGLGREFLKRTHDNLMVELGGGYIVEDRIKSENEDFGLGRAYAKYAHIFTPTATFTQEAEYLHNFKQPKGYRTNSISSLSSALSEHLSLKVAYSFKYVNRPPAGFSKGDSITSLALIVNY